MSDTTMLPTLFIGGPHDGEVFDVHVGTEYMHFDKATGPSFDEPRFVDTGTYRIRFIEASGTGGVCRSVRIGVYEDMSFETAIERMWKTYHAELSK